MTEYYILSIYFFLVLSLSLPFLLLNKLTDVMPFSLPNSSIMIIVPMIVALIFSYFNLGISFDQLWATFSIINSKDWIYLVASLFIPIIMYGISYIVYYKRLISSTKFNVSLKTISFAGVLYFVSAVIEEIGWTAFATQVATKSIDSVFVVSVLVGIVWQLWHLFPFLQLGRSRWWILFHCLTAIGYRVIMTYFFVHTNSSIYPAILIHTMINLAPELMPMRYETYNPALTAIIIWSGIIIASMII